MHTHTDFSFKIENTLMVDSVIEWLNSRISDNEGYVNDEGYVCIDDTYEIFSIDQMIELLSEFVSDFPDVSFTVSGVIDSSESAGEYMDFEGSFGNGYGSLNYSDWYVYCYASDYEDATDEDFEDAENGFFYPIARSEIESYLKYVRETGDDEPRIVSGSDKKLYDEPPMNNVWTISWPVDS